MPNKELRNMAMMLATQLPNDKDEAYCVIFMMKELLDKWLYQGTEGHPLFNNSDSVERYEAFLRDRGLTAGVGVSGSATNVIKLAGRDDKSPL